MIPHFVSSNYVLNGAWPDPDVVDFLKWMSVEWPLICADPPFGGVLNVGWDREIANANDYAEWCCQWLRVCGELQPEGGACYVWGGIGTVGYRGLYALLAQVEDETPYRIANHITWSKRRAYGVQHNYLFTREELIYLVKGDPKKPRYFKPPYLDQLRGYAGYDAQHPAKSEYLRRTNVWTDVTEILRGKVHVCQKPERLAEIQIEASSRPGEWVLDLFAGSGGVSRAAHRLGRRFVAVERDPQHCTRLITSLSQLQLEPKEQHS